MSDTTTFMQDKTFYIKTFGCQMNIRDSEIMAQKLAEHGYTPNPDMEAASLIVINTCSVRAKAEQKVFSLLGSLRQSKQRNPEQKICVAGCVAQQEGQRILDRMGHVDLVIGTQRIYEIGALVEQSKGGATAINLSDGYEIPRLAPRPVATETTGSPSAAAGFRFSRFVTIMQGCDNFCTYCVVPHTRGREVSRKAADILEEISALVASGVIEITLLGQNVNSYGTGNAVVDSGLPYSFPQLLKEVAAIEGLQRLRFTTSHPKDLSDELIACFAQLDTLCPQFHLPVQSGSDAVLRRMNRKYRVADYLDKVARLRAARPDIALTTDMIIGFPGETERDFQQTMELLEQVRFHGSFSFKYSDRPGTGAADLNGKIDEETKGARLQVFQKRQDEISLEYNRGYVGTTQPVLIETVDGAQATGRSPTNHIVHVSTGKQRVQPGDIVTAVISHGGMHALKAELSLQ